MSLYLIVPHVLINLGIFSNVWICNESCILVKYAEASIYV